ncbi:SRPBCC domain-containing protein [Bernardetia sp.]|uniref:SRPBCC domain-containing protein n=1 Tax=Bernardetia sp. TaxID=1937974 RepID=UPI0025C089F9|nr:SRPBCC domain-containing protein [Bernardetia sp.]
MAYQIQTSINIQSTPQKIWSILTDFKNYPNWNPFIKSIEGTPKVGNKIIAKIQPPNSNLMSFTPKVLVFDENKEFVWLGHLLFKGLFDGEHRFKLIDNQDGTTTFVQSENFKGLFVPIFKSQLDKNTRTGFELMNQKLKELAENE